MMNKYPLLLYFSLFSSIIPIGAGFSRIKILHSGMKILLLFLTSAFAADYYFIWFARGYQFTLALHHIYYLVEFIFIISIVTVWQESYSMKWMFRALSLFFIIFWIIAKISFEPLTGLYTVIASVSQIVLALSSGYTLFIVIGNKTQSLINQYRFWVLLSFVVYYSGTLLTIGLRGILLHYSIDTIFLVVSIDWSLKIIFNMLIAIGFLCRQTQT
jgi:hypothetical protein